MAKTILAILLLLPTDSKSNAQEQTKKVQMYWKGGLREIHLTRLSRETRRLCDETLPSEIRDLAELQDRGTLDEGGRLRLRSYRAAIEIANWYRFLDRILTGDLSVAEDLALQRKYKIIIRRLGKPTPVRSRVEPRCVLIIDGRELYARAIQGDPIPAFDLLELHLDAGLKLETTCRFLLSQRAADVELEKYRNMERVFAP